MKATNERLADEQASASQNGADKLTAEEYARLFRRFEPDFIGREREEKGFDAERVKDLTAFYLKAVEASDWKQAEAAAEALGFMARPRSEDGEDRGGASTWALVDLAPILANENIKPPPIMLPRDDGAKLIYAGKKHLFFGEPESAKGWLMLLVCKERIEAKEHVLYIDFDDEAEEAVGRLKNDLGLAPELIAEYFHYIRPDDAFDDDARAEIERVLDEYGPKWVVLDGLTYALANDGITAGVGTEVASWFQGLPTLLARRGIAVGMVDHVPKSHEARGGFPVDSHAKKMASDVLYEMRVKEPLGRGMTGEVRVYCRKDRGGYVRPLPEPGTDLVSDLIVESDADGRLSIELAVPSATDAGDEWEPTFLMGKASRAVAAEPGINLTDLRAVVGGRAKYTDQAISLLKRGGYIRTTGKKGTPTCHYEIEPYVEPKNEPPEEPPAPGEGAVSFAP